MRLSAETRLPSSPDRPDYRLRRLRRRAAFVLLWEDLWPPVAFAGAITLAFVAASWLGIWLYLPPWAHIVALILSALALAAALAPLLWVRMPRRARALGRLDRDASVAHRPASALEDTLANPKDDLATLALWDLHKRRVERDLARLTVNPPSPRLARRDPYALRFAAILFALLGFFAAGAERFPRLAAAFYFMPTLAHGVGARVDAWIDPPAYTGRPPIFLKITDSEIAKTVTAPEGSLLVVRADPGVVNVSVKGGLSPLVATSRQERRFEIRKQGEAKIYRGGALAADVVLSVEPKTAPTIRLLDPPRANASGSLTLHYAIEDAYGVREAGATVTQVDPATVARSLFGPPKPSLSLPGGVNGVGEARSTLDLSDHPWAGAHVTLRLVARSVSNATASSPPVDLILPQRRFINPLSKALVELRRDLVLYPDRNAARVERVLETLQLGPVLFQTSPRVYLELQGVSQLLRQARSDDDLRGVAGWLWSLALSIENGDASQALKDLRAAEDKLRQALRNGASPEELKRLTEDLRAAAERYLAEMMRNADKLAKQGADQMDMQDMGAMLDRLQRDADAGAKDDAQAMLDELQNMTENLRAAENEKPDPAMKEMRQSLRDLNTLLKDQQALRDDTFRQDQRERSGSVLGPSEKNDRQLEDRQRNLGDRLGKIQRRLRGAGVEPPKNLRDAAGDMEDAERSLKSEGKSDQRFGRSTKGDAVDAQGKAIDALRQGGQEMAKQMRGRGKGRNRYVGIGDGGQSEQDDPLGRGQEGAKGAAVGALNGGPDRADRARRVLEELRRRLSNPNRSSEERDYLERLIDRP